MNWIEQQAMHMQAISFLHIQGIHLEAGDSNFTQHLQQLTVFFLLLLFSQEHYKSINESDMKVK